MPSLARLALALFLLSFATCANATVFYQQTLVNTTGAGTGHGTTSYVMNGGGSAAHAFFLQVQSGSCVPTPQGGYAFYLGGTVSNYFYVENCDGEWFGDGQYHWTMYDFSGNSPCGGYAGLCNSFNFADWTANNYFIFNWSGAAYLDLTGNLTPALVLQDDTAPPPNPRGLPITITHKETLALEDDTTVWSGGAGYAPYFTPYTLNPTSTPYQSATSFQLGKIHIGSNVDSSDNNHDGIGNAAAWVYDSGGNAIATSNVCYVEGGCNGADLMFAPGITVPANFSLSFITTDGAQGDSGFTLSQIGIYSEDPHPAIANPIQLATDGKTVIPEGGSAAGNEVVLEGVVGSSSTDPLALQVEVELVGTSFINIASGVSANVTTGVVASVPLPGLGPGAYHWQFRVVDMSNLIASPWQAFGPGTSADFSLSGGLFGPPLVTVTPNPVVFPLAVGPLSCDTGSPVQTQILVANMGGSTLHLTQDPQIGGVDFFDFTISSSTGSCINGSQVAVGGSCPINVTFTPDKPCQPFAEIANLTLVDDAAGPPQVISLSGGAPFSAIIPDPVAGSVASQAIQVVGTGIQSGASIRVADLRPPKTYIQTNLGGVTSAGSATANLAFGNPSQTSTWAITVIDPDGTNPSPRLNDPNHEIASKAAKPKLMTNPYYFQVLGSSTSLVPSYVDGYPFQNGTLCPRSDSVCPPYSIDPYGWPFRECTSYVAWNLNQDSGAINPRTSIPSFMEGLGGKHWGNAGNWSGTASALGYEVFTEVKPGSSGGPQRGDVAQWVSINHVAYVEAVNGDGSINVSEFNYPEDHTYTTRTLSPSSSVNGAFPDNFIRIRTMSVQPISLTFPVTAINSVSSPLAITVTNTDKRGPISITGTLSPAAMNEFQLSDTCGVSIEPMGVCQVLVTFTPTTKGLHGANLKIVGTAGTQTVKLSGTGTAPVPPVATGTIIVETNTPNATFTLSGPSNHSGSGTSQTFSNLPAGDYSVSFGPGCRSDLPPTSTMTLAVGGTVTFTGTYKPGFLTEFPLAGSSPCTEKINTVFDHHQATPYSNDNIVVAYTGESGSCVASSSVQNFQSPVGVQHPHSGFRQQSGNAFTVNGHYTGGGSTSPTVTCANTQAAQASLPSNALLFYDGHPGYDYYAPCGTNVYAAVAGTVQYPSTIPGLQTGGGGLFHVLELDPDSPNTSYKIYYLHLSTYPSVEGASVSCMNAGPIFAAGTHVIAGQLIGKSGDAGVAGGPHLHFEVQESGVPVDPYGWKGPGNDPYNTTNINLWP